MATQEKKTAVQGDIFATQKTANNTAESLDLLIEKWTRAIDNAKPDLVTLCAMWQQLGEQYDDIDALRKALLVQWERLNKELLPKAFEEKGVDKIQISELARSFYPLDKYSASLVDKEAAFQWLRDNKLDSLITETVNAGTLAATLRARLLEENLDPPESMKLTQYKIIGSSKYTPKEKK